MGARSNASSRGAGSPYRARPSRVPIFWTTCADSTPTPASTGFCCSHRSPAGVSAEAAALAIDPAKDVDGQHPMNLGRIGQRRPAFAPATALGGLRLLKHYEIPLSGTRVVVVGRSPVVGMPLALLLTDADATVTICHSRTREMADVTRTADVLCVAIGRAGLITPDHVKPGAIVVDFGTNPTPDGSLVGDVQTEAVQQIASAITPVPGGAGPTTVSVLAEQTLRAANLLRGL